MTLTNIICNVVITLLTNTVESDNGVKGCGHLPSYEAERDRKPGETLSWMSLAYLHPGTECSQAKQPTEKTVTTTVTERTEVTYALPPGESWIERHLNRPEFGYGRAELEQFRGMPRTITQDREISRTVKRFVKSQEWVEVKTAEIETFLTNQFILSNVKVWPGVVTNAFQFKSSNPSNIIYLDPWMGFDIVKATNDLARWREIMEDFIQGLKKIGEQKEPR